MSGCDADGWSSVRWCVLSASSQRCEDSRVSTAATDLYLAATRHTTPGPSTVVMNNIATNTPTLPNFNNFLKINKMENRIKSIKEIHFI